MSAVERRGLALNPNGSRRTFTATLQRLVDRLIVERIKQSTVTYYEPEISS